MCLRSSRNRDSISTRAVIAPFAAPAGVPRDVIKIWDSTLEKVHKSAAWKDYMARNMYEDVYMNAEQFTRWLREQQAELTRFITEMGLVQKK